jgi:O-antigen/teichoic acid export membrane protein
MMLALTAWWAPIWGLVGTILAMAAGFAVTLVLTLYFTWNLVGAPWSRLSAIWSQRRILIEFCLPSLLGGIIIVPASWLATAIIAARNGPIEPLLAGLLILPPSWLASMGLAFHYSAGLREVALFTAADQFRPLLALLANLVAQPMMPLVTGQIRKAEETPLSPNPAPSRGEGRRSGHRGVQRAIERSFQLTACLILPAHAFFAFAAPYVMALFGRTFAADWNVFLVVLAWGAMAGMVSLIGVALYAQGQVWLQNLFMMIYGLILVIVTWVLQSWGEFALATGHLTATLSTFILGGFFLYRAGFLSWRAVLVQLVAMVWITIISICAWLVPSSWRVLSVPVAVGITGLLLFVLLQSETKQVLHLLRRKLRWAS